LIFQPAEEVLPGGALQMIAEGVLENPKPETIVAQHVFPELPVGKVGFRKGEYMASSDEINIYVRGKGGHAAMPERGDDGVWVASQLIVELKKRVNELAPKDVPTVLSFGKIIGNGAHNVFPSEVAIQGTFRTFDESWRTRVHKIINEVAKETTGKFGLSYEVVIDKGYPVLINDDSATQVAIEAAKDFLGENQVVELPRRMTVEDFAYFARQVPGCFYRLGVANPEKGITSGLHTPTFDVDEESIKVGTGLLTWIALKQLEK
jgi:amidohydrolase